MACWSSRGLSSGRWEGEGPRACVWGVGRGALSRAPHLGLPSASSQPLSASYAASAGTRQSASLAWAANWPGAACLVGLPHPRPRPTFPHPCQVVRNPDQVATNWPIPLSQADAARWKEEQIAKHGEVDGPVGGPAGGGQLSAGQPSPSAHVHEAAWMAAAPALLDAGPTPAHEAPSCALRRRPQLFEPGFCQVSDPGAAQRSQGQISDDPCDVITRELPVHLGKLPCTLVPA